MSSSGRSLSARDRIDAGVEIEFPPPPEDAGLRPDPSVSFEVVYEDEWLAVIDKPSGVVVHPGAGNREGTLAAGLLARWPEIRGVGDTDRWGIVHRLDRETSGLLVIAKTGTVYAELQSAIATRAVRRQYYALVRGGLQTATGTIDAPLGRDPARPTRVAVVPEGRAARTHYEVVRSWGERASLLDITLESGRTHQIRVHLASIGHPVFDDRVYGGRGATSGAGRVWLHAHRLEFDHPVTGTRVEVETPLPPELEQSLTELDKIVDG